MRDGRDRRRGMRWMQHMAAPGHQVGRRPRARLPGTGRRWRRLDDAQAQVPGKCPCSRSSRLNPNRRKGRMPDRETHHYRPKKVTPT